MLFNDTLMTFRMEKSRKKQVIWVESVLSFVTLRLYKYLN